MAQMVKNLSATQENWVQSLSQEYSLEKGMATHSSILAWRSPWTEEPGGLQSIMSQRVGHEQLTLTFSLECELIKKDRIEFYFYSYFQYLA